MSAILHRNLRRPLGTAARGAGAFIVDAAGKQYLDACGGAAVSILGHSNRRVIEAVKQQAETLAYVHSSFFTNAPAEELAEKLLGYASDEFASGRVMFLGSGSEAVEAALKLARQYHVERGEPGRRYFIARDMAYHGNTLGALSVGGHYQRRLPYEPMLMPDVGRVPACYAYRHMAEGESEEEYGLRVANELEREVARLGPQNIAAFIAEPVSGATLGSVPPVPGYFRKIREICDHHGILFIADEVMCGSGRTGTFFALEQEGVSADIIVIAKGLGAGYQPIAAVLASGKVISAIESGSGLLWNGHTYMGHSVACAASLEVTKIIDEEDLLANVIRQGSNLEQSLRDRFGQHPNVGDIRGRGLFWSIEFVSDRATKQPLPKELDSANVIKNLAQQTGLLCYASRGCVDGANGDHIMICPAYDITDTQIEFVTDALAKTLEQFFRS